MVGLFKSAASAIATMICTAVGRRPEQLSELRGQGDLVQAVELLISGAKKRGQTLGHTLLKGPPGTGKTTIARILAKEMEKPTKEGQPPALPSRLVSFGIGEIKSPEDVRRVLHNIDPGDILFIDEIHQLPRRVQEQFFHAMESPSAKSPYGEVSLTTDRGPVPVSLPPWTLLGATTLAQKLDPAFLRRFQNTFDLRLMLAPDLVDIIRGMIETRGIKSYTEGAISMLAGMGGGTPGESQNMVERAENTMAWLDTDTLDEEVVRVMRSKLNLDQLGLGPQERDILAELARRGKMSLNALSATLGIDRDMLNDVVETKLVREGLMRRGSGGREITEKGLQHLREYESARVARPAA